MNSCDFSIEQYNFDDVAGDYNLEFFDYELRREQQMRIPMIKEILKRKKGDINIFVSPWSPPAWMKEAQKDGTATSMIGSAQPLGLLNDSKVVKGVFIVVSYSRSTNS